VKFTGERMLDSRAAFLYRGNGRGGFASGGLRIGNGWDIYR